MHRVYHKYIEPGPFNPVSGREETGESPLQSGPLYRMVGRHTSFHNLLEPEGIEHRETEAFCDRHGIRTSRSKMLGPQDVPFLVRRRQEITFTTLCATCEAAY